MAHAFFRHTNHTKFGNYPIHYASVIVAQLFGPDYRLKKEDFVVTKAMQDMQYHAAQAPPVHPGWLNDASFWVLGPNNSFRCTLQSVLASLWYKVRPTLTCTVNISIARDEHVLYKLHHSPQAMARIE